MQQFNRTRLWRGLATSIGILAIVWIAAAAGAAAQEEAAEPSDVFSIDLAFINHLDAGLVEQDVYVEHEAGSDEVFRFTKGWNDMDAPIFTTAIEVKHDPFNAEALGPYPKGKAVGMTVGDWFRHKGTGKYTCTAGEGMLDVSFSGLVPNGVYTMWHAFIALPPTTPFSGTLDIPLGARDGSTSVFEADADGNAAFNHTFQPCLELSDVWTTSMLAINWHSDGKTYGAYPGDFGLNSHIPIFLMLPPREGME